MARTFKIVKGDPASPTTSINVINTGATGWIAKRGGLGRPRFGISMDAGNRVVDGFEIRLKGSSHDNAASQVQTFVKLLRDAYLYHQEPWQNEPVYLQVQTTGESNDRFALIFASPELEWPDLFDFPFEGDSELDALGLSVIREHPWTSEAPGQLGDIIELDASDGPADPTIVHVANFRDDGALTHVKVDDGGSFTDIISAATGTDLFPAAPAANDALYIGSTDIPPKHACIGIATAMASFSGTLVLEYWDGADWNTVTALGTDYTIFAENGGEVTTIDDLFTQTGLWSINIFPWSDWAKTTIDTINAYWIRIRISAFTSIGVVPEKDGNAIYAQASNYVEVPAAAIGGDFPPKTLLRLWAPSGGDENVGKANLSRILIGAKSRGIDGDNEDFCFSLNLGNVDNPSPWSTSYGTDGSSVADEEAPGNAHAAVSFSSSASSVVRVTLTGDDVLDHWVGEYRLFVRLQQIGGSAGDTSVSARIFIGGSAASDPHIDTRSEVTRGADNGPEVLDLGLISLPFSRSFNVDSLAAADVVIQIFAARSTGSSTLRLYDVMLFPVDEGSVGLDDPVADTTNGPSALRGGTVLDVDAGLIADRNQKYHVQGANLIPAEFWSRMGAPIPLTKLATKTRLYFLLEHYTDAGWGVNPLGASLGLHIAFELYMHTEFGVLRGAS